MLHVGEYISFLLRSLDGNCLEGHTGSFCSQCQTMYFSDENSLCQPCEQTAASAQEQLNQAMIAFVSFVCLVGISITVLDELWLDRMVVVLVSMQQSVQVSIFVYIVQIPTL